MYAVIRSEASGLNQAIIQFALDAGLTTVREQLMDVDLKASGELDKSAKEGHLIVFGVTCDPDLARTRVAERPNPMQSEEVTRAIQGFRRNVAFGHLAEISEKTFLFDTTNLDKAVSSDSSNLQYQTVFVAKSKGTETFRNVELFNKFKGEEKYPNLVPESWKNRISASYPLHHGEKYPVAGLQR